MRMTGTIAGAGRIAAAGLLGTTFLAQPVLADAVDDLLPHRAVYDLTLVEASERSGISAMNGRIVYEVTGSRCEGFSTRFRFFTDVRTPRKNFTNDQRTTGYESGDGKTFNFITQSYLNGQLEQDLRGEAQRTADATNVTLSKPEERELTLPPAVFMTGHIIKIIEAAQAEQTFYTTPVFDGSEGGDELVDTTAVIGKMRKDGGKMEGEEDSLARKFAGESTWPVSVSYFSTAPQTEEGEKLPIYQVSFTLHESGVSRGLTMRYEDYSLKADLTRIEYLEKTPCKS